MNFVLNVSFRMLWGNSPEERFSITLEKRFKVLRCCRRWQKSGPPPPLTPKSTSITRLPKSDFRLVLRTGASPTGWATSGIKTTLNWDGSYCHVGNKNLLSRGFFCVIFFFLREEKAQYFLLTDNRQVWMEGLALTSLKRGEKKRDKTERRTWRCLCTRI